MNRVATGIKGFDGLIEGGLPKGSNVLLTGVPGTGKTIFGMEYLYKGAELGENGLFISLDSSLNMLRQQSRQFGWDIEGMEEAGKLFLFRVPLHKVKFNLFEMVDKLRKEIGAQRLVFDNIASFVININLFPLPPEYAEDASAMYSRVQKKGVAAPYTTMSIKRMVYLTMEMLAGLGTTNLIITYGNRGSDKLTMDGVSEFACDGIIELYNELIGAKRARTLSVLKMRDTNHSQYIHDFEFGPNGIVVKPSEEVYK